MQNYKTFNEMRAEMNLPSLGARGDIILNQNFISEADERLAASGNDNKGIVTDAKKPKPSELDIREPQTNTGNNKK